MRVRVHDALLTHPISGPTLALAVTVREREREWSSWPAVLLLCSAGLPGATAGYRGEIIRNIIIVRPHSVLLYTDINSKYIFNL